MKTILFLENGVSGGGSFVSLLQLVKHLNHDRFRAIVVFVNRTLFYDHLQNIGIPTYLVHDSVYSQSEKHIWCRLKIRILLNIKRFFPSMTVIIDRILHRRAIHEISNLVKKYKVDLIHLNNQGLRDLYGVIAAKKMRVPCVSHLRSARALKMHPKVTQFLNRNVVRFIANSHFTKRHWEGFGLDHKKIDVVYNAIEEVSFSSIDIRKRWEIDSGVKYVIGCVGNFAEGKGHEFLITALKKVFEQESSVILVLVGDGLGRKRLEAFVHVLGLTDKVIFLGYQSRVKEIISGFDLLVVPSKMETFGRVILEAMSMSIPVVATRVGGIPELIKHDYNGLLVEYGDEDSLVKAILQVCENQELRSRFIANGKKIVSDRFTLKEHIDVIEKIYDAIVDPRVATDSEKLHSR